MGVAVMVMVGVAVTVGRGRHYEKFIVQSGLRGIGVAPGLSGKSFPQIALHGHGGNAGQGRAVRGSGIPGAVENIGKNAIIFRIGGKQDNRYENAYKNGN